MNNGDEGYALIWSLTLAGVLLLVGAAGVSLCAVGLAHARAGNAADLAAVAAASHLDDPCAAAERIAARNAAELVECAVSGTDVTVRVAVTSPNLARWLGQDRLEASARAGSDRPS